MRSGPKGEEGDARVQGPWTQAQKAANHTEGPRPAAKGICHFGRADECSRDRRNVHRL
jgi:hypothetical protein